MIGWVVLGAENLPMGVWNWILVAPELPLSRPQRRRMAQREVYVADLFDFVVATRGARGRR